MFPPDPSIKFEKHCFVYCGDERCDCSANPTRRDSPPPMTSDPTNPAPPVEELREVTQSDREAGERMYRFVQSVSARPHSPNTVERTATTMLAGKWDADESVQAFARHRLDHLSSLTVENERLRAALVAIDEIVERTTKKCDGPHRVLWDGVVYEGPLAGAMLTTFRAFQGLARAALSSLPAMKGEG